MTSFGGRNMYTGDVTRSYDDISQRVTENPGTKIFTLPPLMHGAAQWAAMTSLTTGQTIVFAEDPSRFDADEVVRIVEREQIMTVQVVGDAMARPLADAIERGSADVSSLAVVANGGALLTPTGKQRRVVGDRHSDEPHVGARRGVHRHVQRGPGHQCRLRGPHGDSGARPRRHRLVGPTGLRAIGLQG
jgi:acyl-CoA synthetase (AMP-forming)/AMP-acid ligase II